MENLTGQHIDRYKILELLGKGGMAMVYKAYDSRLEREVAVKIIRRDAFPPEILHEILKRFEREAKSLARLSHPNIVKVLDYGEFEGSPFLVMEYFSGGTLREKMGKPLSWREAARTLLPIARGVEYAHNREVIHRDIKPANILIAENGEPTLSDFGIAKLFQDEKTTVLTGSGVAMGTPEYMAPEQWTGQPGYKSDMYSLAIILYEMVTGSRPYHAETPAGVFLKQVTEPLPIPSGVVPNLPESVERFLFKALAKDPADRFADLGTFVAELENLLNNNEINDQSSTNGALTRKLEPEPVSKVPVSSASMPARPLPRMAILGGTGIVLGVIGIAVIVALIFGLPKIQGLLVAPPSSTPISPTDVPTVTVIPSTETPTVEPTPLPLEILDAQGVTMRLVPAGEFTMGWAADSSLVECQKFRDDCELAWFVDEEPPHPVYLDSFYMDIYEVTNAFYKTCVDSGTCTPPNQTSSETRPNYYGNADFDDYPVINVDWNQAKAYCEWRGGSLPSEAQWEKSARGTDGRSYTWGEEIISCDKANYNNTITKKRCVGDTSRVGSYESGKSPYGIYDLAGNVFEWTIDWYSETYYQSSPSSNPTGPATGEEHVLRGGAWINRENAMRVSDRHWNPPVTFSVNIGFRCVRAVSP